MKIEVNLTWGLAGAPINMPMRRVVSMLFVLTLLIVPATETCAAAVRPLRIAYLLTSGTMASLWMAKEIGGFAKEGLDVEVISMSSSLAIPALIAAK
jgi:ABC-type nitrate/sulfonate/bicarbonate transport system substrate-binding protein